MKNIARGTNRENLFKQLRTQGILPVGFCARYQRRPNIGLSGHKFSGNVNSIISLFTSLFLK